MKTPWLPSANTRLANCPENVRVCLTETGSLTRRLAHYCPQDLSLTLLNQAWAKPTLNESLLLDLPVGRSAMIREIVMGYEDRQWMFARTIFPRATFEKRRHLLSRLHLIPLANILFTDRNIRRVNMRLAKLGKRCLAQYHYFKNRKEPTDRLWSRRSLFTIEDSPFLVQEIFLPDMVDDIT